MTVPNIRIKLISMHKPNYFQFYFKHTTVLVEYYYHYLNMFSSFLSKCVLPLI